MLWLEARRKRRNRRKPPELRCSEGHNGYSGEKAKASHLGVVKRRKAPLTAEGGKRASLGVVKSERIANAAKR